VLWARDKNCLRRFLIGNLTRIACNQKNQVDSRKAERQKEREKNGLLNPKQERVLELNNAIRAGASNVEYSRKGNRRRAKLDEEIAGNFSADEQSNLHKGDKTAGIKSLIYR